MTGTDLHAEAERRLSAIDSRYTSGRRALVEVFARTGRPMSLSEVMAADNRLVQSSAYRNLAVLEEAGVVRRIVTADDRTRYELAESITGRHHHHLICAVCGKVEDFVVSAAVEAAIEAELAAVARKRRFDAVAHQVDLTGRCADCR